MNFDFNKQQQETLNDVFDLLEDYFDSDPEKAGDQRAEMTMLYGDMILAAPRLTNILSITRTYLVALHKNMPDAGVLLVELAIAENNAFGPPKLSLPPPPPQQRERI